MLFCIECIEEEKKRENRLIYLAQTDLMTGLYNRGSGERTDSHLLQEKTGGLLCLIDCDKFKTINDTYGHSTGDKVIIAVAETMQKSCRDKDRSSCGLGGDEFVSRLCRKCGRKRRQRDFSKDFFYNISQITIAEMKGKQIEISLVPGFCEASEEVSFDQLVQKGGPGNV